MTTLNSDIIDEALQKVGILDQTQTPDPTTQARALTIMNDYLAMKRLDGWYIGYYPQTAVTDNSPLRDEFIHPIKLVLAREYAINFGQPIQDPLLVKAIQDAEDILVKACRRTVLSDLSELSRPQGGPWGVITWN